MWLACAISHIWMPRFTKTSISQKTKGKVGATFGTIFLNDKVYLLFFFLNNFLFYFKIRIRLSNLFFNFIFINFK